MDPSASVLLNRLLARARFRHVQVLVQLAELGSVRRTAEAVGMTQPGVTQVLADLERMLDVPLFHRHARGVRPTPACAHLLPLARQLMIGLAASAEAVTASRGEGVVRLFASTAAVNGLLVRALPGFTEAAPRVQVQLTEAETDDQMLAIARGEADIVNGRQPPVVPEGWRFVPLLEDRFVVACASDHPLARRRNLGWDDLDDALWLPAPTGSAARHRFDAIMAERGVTLRICPIIGRTPVITWALLRRQPLLTLVPYCVVAHLVDAGELAVLRMRDAMPFLPIGIMLPERDVNDATQRFADHLVKFTAAAPAARRSKGRKSHADR